MFGWLRRLTKRDAGVDTDDYSKPNMTPEFQEDSRVAAQRLSSVLAEARNEIGPGKTGHHISNIVEGLIADSGLESTLKGYRGFPHAVAISVNHQVLHAGPSENSFKDGDLVTVQSNVAYRNGNANLGWTYGVGSLSEEQKLLSEIGSFTLQQIESRIRPSMRVGDIGHLIQTTAENSSLSVVREYCGFGMRPGAVHCDPQILCYGQPESGSKLVEGDVLNIHVIATSGKSAVKLLPDGWTVITRDHSNSAQFVGMFQVGKDELKRMADPPL